jgi:putative Holliday junction resolvase
MISSSAGTEWPGRRVLAIDYGRRRLGLALSDELGMLARPLATLERVNRRADLQKLSAIAGENGVGRIVVGLPLRMDGTPGEMAKEARAFAARLAKAAGLPVELVDERLTSWEAAESVAQSRSAAAKRHAGIDQRAAVLILEEYLRREGGRGQARK